MKTIKLVHISSTQKETKIATFYNLAEAIQCRDLLQTKCSDQDNCYYFIEYYNRKTKSMVMQGADTFTSQVFFMHPSIQHNLKLALS